MLFEGSRPYISPIDTLSLPGVPVDAMLSTMSSADCGALKGDWPVARYSTTLTVVRVARSPVW